MLYSFSKRNVSLILHRKDQFLDMSTATSLTLYHTQSFRTKVTYQQFIGLASPDYTGEVTGVKGKDTCSKDVNYDQCVYQSKEDMMRRGTRQNCTVPFTPNNEKVCNETDDMETTFQIATKTLEKHHCSVPCKSLFINFGGKTMNEEISLGDGMKKKSKKGKKKNGKKSKKSRRGDQYNAKLIFGTRVQKIEEHQLYKFINLIAESGSNFEMRKYGIISSSMN